MLDPHSATWAAVRMHAEQELKIARALLESPSLDRDETQVQRGRIAALKKLLALAEPRRIIPIAETAAYT
jgi:hypothetical protein